MLNAPSTSSPGVDPAINREGPVVERAAPRRGLRRQPRAKLLLVGADLVAVTAGLAIALAFTPHLGFDMSSRDRPSLAALSALSLPAWPVIFARYRLYSSRYVSRGMEEMRRVVLGVGAGVVVLIVLATVVQVSVSRAWLLVVFLTSAGLLCVERTVARARFAELRRHGRLVRRVVIVGRNAEGLAIEQMFRDEPGLGYRTLAFVDDAPERAVTRPDGAPVLGGFGDVADVVASSNADGVIIAATAMDLATSNVLIRSLTEQGVHVELSSTLRDIAPHRLTVRPLGRFPVVYIEPVQNHGWRASAKRGFDLAVALLALLTLAPLFAVAALMIKLDSRGPVFFRQQRVGRNGAPFALFKLRTMVIDAEAQRAALLHLNERRGPLFKLQNDPRVTRIGRFLRATSIDEIPQLWNVVRGEMSLVGPRPALAREVADWSEQLHQRLRVKPGITGMWQVYGRHSDSFELYERLDLYYVDNWSLVTDLAIIAKTVPAVLSRRGAT